MTEQIRPENVNNSETLVAGDIVFGKYRILAVLGAGSFGVVYNAQCIRTKKMLALKVASLKAPISLLRTEICLYRKLSGMKGTAKVHQWGMVHNRQALLMERLGPSLEEMFKLCQYMFSVPTVVQLAIQMIERVQMFHQITGFVHRDIKPENFLLGTGKNENIVHLIDFGLAKTFWDHTTQQHLPRSDTRFPLVGTMRYTSRNGHNGRELTRRDDLESLGYTLVYFLRGSLPWQGMQAATRSQKFELITEKKLSTSFQALCEGLPLEFAGYLCYCNKLTFSAEPEYPILRAMFVLLFQKFDNVQYLTFDWTPERRAITKRRSESSLPKLSL